MPKKRGRKKRITKAMKRKLRGRSVLIRRAKRRTGAVRSFSRDRKRKALPPGKRRTAWGTVYYEARKNRSDLRGGV